LLICWKKKNQSSCDPQMRPTRANGPRWGRPACTVTLTKTTLNSGQTNPQSMSLFLERATMQRNPRKFPPSQWHGPRLPTHAANFAKMPPRYRQIDLGSTTLFPKREAMQKGPRNYPLLPWPGPWPPLRAPVWRAWQWTATPAN